MSDLVQFNQPDAPSLKKNLQTMINSIGQVLAVDFCILRGFSDKKPLNYSWIYRKSDLDELSADLLSQTVGKISDITILSPSETNTILPTETPQESQQRINALTITGISSSLLIPLLLEENLIAVLGFHHCKNEHTWQEQEINLGKMVADQAVLAISQYQAYKQVRAFAQREALINTVTSAIRASLEPQAIFTAITYQLGQALDVDGCALSLWTKQSKFVQCVGLYDRYQLKQGKISEKLPQSQVPIVDNPVLQKLLHTSQPVALEDMEIHPEMNKFDLPLRSPARALLIVPLIVENKIIGSISLRQTAHTRHWSSADIELAKAVAAQAAIAVKQSRLYETTRKQAQKLREKAQQVKKLNQYLTESVLKRFLPASMVKKVAKREITLDLHPEPRLVTILFSDIVGFTPLSNQLGTDRVATLLNEYLESMTQVVFAFGGTVDKFIGDAIFALFGAPESLSPQEQVQRAIAVARAMHQRLKQLNQNWQDQGILGGNGPPLVQFRCGIHQGIAVVGMFGGGQRSDYTAIGPTVNMAARLQKAAEENTILVSESVANYLEAQEINLVIYLHLKGISESIRAFSVRINPDEQL